MTASSDAIDPIRLRHLSERHMRAMRDLEFDLARERLARRLIRDLADRSKRGAA